MSKNDKLSPLVLSSLRANLKVLGNFLFWVIILVLVMQDDFTCQLMALWARAVRRLTDLSVHHRCCCFFKRKKKKKQSVGRHK